MDITSLTKKIRKFAKDRNWEKFHSPKNLSMALICEAAELTENFQWLTEKESYSLPKERLENVKDEMADILIYLIRMSDILGINLLKAAETKIKKNELKYPIIKCKGSSEKYTELD